MKSFKLNGQTTYTELIGASNIDTATLDYMMEYYPEDTSASSASISVEAPLTGNAVDYPIVCSLPTTSAGDADSSSIDGASPGSYSNVVKLTSQTSGGATSLGYVTLRLYNKVWYGLSTNGTLTSAQVQQLSTGVLTNTKTRTFTEVISAGQARYIYYCLPTRLGTVTFSTGLGEGGFIIVTNILSLTNAATYVENYRIYRSENLLGSGTYEITVT